MKEKFLTRATIENVVAMAWGLIMAIGIIAAMCGCHDGMEFFNL